MAVFDTRLLLLCFLVASISGYQHKIFLSKKLHLRECEEVNRSYTQCSSIDETFKALMVHSNSTDVIIEPDDYIVNSSWHFKHLSNIRIWSSQQGNIPIIKCLPNVNNSVNFDTGIAFIGVTNLIIRYLNITGCGMKLVSTSQIKVGHFITLRSALFIQNSTNVVINHVSIYNNNGIGLQIVDTNGLVSISSSYFIGNTINREEEAANLTGGGGVSIELTECSPGVTTCNSHDNQYNANSKYTIYQCTFENNSAINHYTNEPDRPTSDTHVYYGFGGGLSIGIHGHAHHNFFKISESNFSLNVANSGGGFNVEIKQNAKHNDVTISHSLISENSALTYQGGGGSDIGIAVAHYSEQISNNSVIIVDCIFMSNYALKGSGGGILWYVTHEANAMQPTNRFEVYNTLFVQNEAQYGSAIQINKDYFSSIIGGQVLSLLLDNCSFIGNELRFDVSESGGIGAVAASGINIQFRKSTLFFENKCTALVMDDAIVQFLNHSYTNFQDNRGLHGGAILLMGSSLMELYYNTTLMFLQNTATGYGGAIYVELSAPYDYLISHACFVRYFDDSLMPGDWTASVIFVNNSAITNNAIFANTLHPCMKFYLQNISFLYEKPFNYSTSDHYNLIATSPMLFKFVSDNSGLVYIVPGEVYNLGVYLVDELHQNITNVMFIATCREPHSPHVVPIYRVTNGPVQIAGEPNDTCQLQLTTDTDYQISKMLQVTLSDCPPGFVYDKYHLKCKCLVNHTHGNPAINGCDLESFQAYFNYFYWIGYVGNSPELFIGSCPYRYCYTDHVPQTKLLPKYANRTILDEFICGVKNRTGVLCGKCVDGYSVKMNSPSLMCYHCKDNQLGVLYLLLSYVVPVTVLFYFIIAFNIRLTTGPFSAFLLFSQIISSQYHLDFIYARNVNSPVALAISSVLLTVYGVSNLNFLQHEVFSYCLFNNAGTVDILAFNVLLSLYPLLLIVAYFLVRRYCMTKFRCQLKCCTLLFNSSVTHGICAFLVLCFARFNSVFAILKSTGIYPIDNPNNAHETVVYLQGDIRFFQEATYNIYAIGSILISITLIAIPIVVLMLYPFISNIVIIFRLEGRHGLHLVNRCLFVHKLKPILDSFQGDYKNHLQFFAGVYFFLYKTLFFCIVIAGSSPDVNSLLLFLIMFFLSITLVHMLTMPYKKYKDNAAYSFVYILLSIIIFLEYFMFTSAKSSYAVTMLWFKLLLSALPLCFVVGYSVWWIAVKIRSCSVSNVREYKLLVDFPDRLINDNQDSEEDSDSY